MRSNRKICVKLREGFCGVDIHRKDMTITDAKHGAAPDDVEAAQDFVDNALSPALRIQVLGHEDLARRGRIKVPGPADRIGGRRQHGLGLHPVGTAPDDLGRVVALLHQLGDYAVALEPIVGGEVADQDFSHAWASANERSQRNCGSSRCNSNASMTSRSFNTSSCVRFQEEYTSRNASSVRSNESR